MNFAPTPADLNFRIAGIPVRIHPLFWVLALLIGPIRETDELGVVAVALLWVAAVLLGILVHEFGHALIVKHVLGARPRVFLYAFGGLTVHQPHECRRDGTGYSILLSAAGPLAGFLSVGVIIAIAYLLQSLRLALPSWEVHWSAIALSHGISWARIPVPVIETPWNAFSAFLFFYTIISIFWGILNLLPIYPMDGGQIMREVCVACSRRYGIIVSLWISVFTATAIATWKLGVWMQTREGFPFLAIFFAFFAVQSLQAVFFYTRGYR